MTVLTVLRGCVIGIWIVLTVLTVLRRGVLDVWTVLTVLTVLIGGNLVEIHDILNNIG